MQFDLKDATVRLEDGSTPPKYTELTISEGTASFTEHKARIYTLNRGKLDTVKNDDEEGMDVSITAIWDKITGTVTVDGATVPSAVDALKQQNSAADWVSAESDDPCAPYAVSIVLEILPPCGGDGAQRITLPYFRYESLAFDMGAATIAIDGKCNALEAITEALESSLTGAAFTPASVEQGEALTVTWDAEFVPGDVFIDLLPTTGTPIRIGQAAAKKNTATITISKARVPVATGYRIRVTAAQIPTESSIATGTLSVTAAP